MQDAPHTKDEVLARCRRAAEAFDAAVAALTEDELLAPGAAGEWSARDVLAHVYADTRWFWGQMVGVVEGRAPRAEECYGDYAPPGGRFDMNTQDGRNAFSIERTKEMSLEEVRAGLADYRARLFEVLERVPEEEWAAPYTIVEHGDIGRVRRAVEGEVGFPPAPLWRWVMGATWHHYEDHLPDLRRGRGQSS